MGSHGQRKRWKICVSMTNDYLGDVIGEAYSRIHFDKERKALVRKTNLLAFNRCLIFIEKLNKKVKENTS